MERSEAKKIIREEDLRRWAWYTRPESVECIAIYPDQDAWVVVGAGERMDLRGLSFYPDEGEALDRFISRLRALNRMLRREETTVGIQAPWGGTKHFTSGADIDTVEP